MIERWKILTKSLHICIIRFEEYEPYESIDSKSANLA